MKYAVETIINGNFSIHSEHGEDKNAAIMEWHAVCRALRNDAGTREAVVKVINSEGGQVEGYYELIKPVVVTAE